MATFTQQQRHTPAKARFSGNRITLSAAIAALALSGCASLDLPGNDDLADLPNAEDIAIVASPSPESDIPPTAALKRNPDRVTLRSDAPAAYVVQQHDTLWDIAAYFLEDAYTWPEIWHQNPGIVDPHLIFPGDEIALELIDGKPVLSINRGKRGNDVLQPRVRESELKQSVPVVAADVLRNFDAKPQVISNETLNAAPYVLDNEDGRLISATGDKLYVRGITSLDQKAFHVLRPNKPLIDPDTNEILGFEALHAGEAYVYEHGDPATITLTKTSREVLRGDRLMPRYGEKTYRDLRPVMVSGAMTGKIISLVDALSKAGQYQIIVFNKGANDGLQAGSMVELTARNRTVLDDTINPDEPELVTLPDQRKGVAIVFETFDWVSYAMILEAQRPVDLYDDFKGF